MLKKLIVYPALCAVLALLSACQGDVINASSFSASSQISIDKLMPVIAQQSAKCLVGKGKLFPQLRASSELNSLSQRPRVLLVERNNQRGLPLLVIEGRPAGTGTQISVFGSVLNSSNAATKVYEAVGLWAAGKSVCS